MKIFTCPQRPLRSFRSLFAIGMMLAAPLVLTGLIYFAFGGISSGSPDLPAVKIGVLNADVLPASAPITTSIGQSISDMFHDQSVSGWLIAVDFNDEAAARRAVDNQEVAAAVLVPPSFTADLLAGAAGAKVVIVQDPTLSIGPQMAANMVQSLLDGVAGGAIAVQTVVQRQQADGLALEQAGIAGLVQRYQDWYMDFQRRLFHDPGSAALAMVAPDRLRPARAGQPPAGDGADYGRADGVLRLLHRGVFHAVDLE